MAGVYASYSKWIDAEIDLAEDGFTNSKPILAIEPWGAERTSKRVKDAADKIVKVEHRERRRGNSRARLNA